MRVLKYYVENKAKHRPHFGQTGGLCEVYCALKIYDNFIAGAYIR